MTDKLIIKYLNKLNIATTTIYNEMVDEFVKKKIPHKYMADLIISYLASCLHGSIVMLSTIEEQPNRLLLDVVFIKLYETLRKRIDDEDRKAEMH